MGLVACNASSVQSSLRGFAGRFTRVTEAARALPRDGVIRDLADTLIQAAEQEEAGLRLLRDTWQPGNVAIMPATADNDLADNGNDLDNSNVSVEASPFEAVDIARSSSSVLRQQVADDLNDRKERTTPESLDNIGEFVAVFNTTDAAWDTFHQEYDAFRSLEGQLTSGEIVTQLGLLIDQFRNIVISIRQVPTTETTRDVVDALAQAGEEEDLALRRVRGTFQRNEGLTNGESAASSGENGGFEGDNAASSTGSSEEGSEGSFTALDLGLFDAFDAQLVLSNAARLQVRHSLEDILEAISEETEIIVEDFSVPYQVLLQGWNDFHKDYDEWRQTEGGCDRSKAVDTLGRFTVTFGNIASNVRILPTAAVLRPLGEILVEAAEREERALRALTDGWRPFEVQVYRTFDQERSAAGKLRRQVAVGLQELLERFNISSDELE